eukprot:763794-Hanusia_phi.AAC.6
MAPAARLDVVGFGPVHEAKSLVVLNALQEPGVERKLACSALEAGHGDSNVADGILRVGALDGEEEAVVELSGRVNTDLQPPDSPLEALDVRHGRHQNPVPVKVDNVQSSWGMPVQAAYHHRSHLLVGLQLGRIVVVSQLLQSSVCARERKIISPRSAHVYKHPFRHPVVHPCQVHPHVVFALARSLDNLGAVAARVSSPALAYSRPAGAVQTRRRAGNVLFLLKAVASAVLPSERTGPGRFVQLGRDEDVASYALPSLQEVHEDSCHPGVSTGVDQLLLELELKSSVGPGGFKGLGS